MRVDKALSLAAQKLADVGILGGARDARDIMAMIMNVNAEKITLYRGDELRSEQQDAFFETIKLRAKKKPVSHLVGGRAFYDRWFKVTPDVLDPRPETEVLVQAALGARFVTLLDLGVGSGAIVITLLAEQSDAVGIGVDVSPKALRVAKENAVANCVDGRLSLMESDWFSAVKSQFDLIVANPPYIAADEMDDLQPEVRLHEPRIALTDEADGLTAYRKITAGAPDHLTPGGRLIVEIGPTQAQAVSQMMQDAGFVQIRVIPDLDGRDRVVVGIWPQTAA